MTNSNWLKQLSKQTTNKTAFIGTTHNLNYNIALTYLTHLKKTSKSSLYEHIMFGYDMSNINYETLEKKEADKTFFHYNNFITFHFDLFDKASWNSLIACDNVFIGTLLNAVKFNEKANYLKILAELFEFLHKNGVQAFVLIPDFVLAGTSYLDELKPIYDELVANKTNYNKFKKKNKIEPNKLETVTDSFSYINHKFKQEAEKQLNSKHKISINSMQYAELDMSKFGSFRLSYYYTLNQLAYYYKTTYQYNIRRVFVPAIVQDYEIENSGLEETIMKGFVTKTKNYRGFTFHHIKRSFFTFDKFAEVLYYLHLEERNLNNNDVLFADLDTFNSAYTNLELSTKFGENTKLYFKYYLYENSIDLFQLGFQNFSWFYYFAYIVKMTFGAIKDYFDYTKGIQTARKYNFDTKLNFNNLVNMNNYFFEYYQYYGSANKPNSKHF